ncbi:MAG TPA: hypothetical protein VG497_30585 [Kribbella sp.]|nr:hypothetical protein [Kribbella sp.]
MSTLTRDMVLDRTRLLARTEPPLPKWHVDCSGEGHEIEAEVRDCRTCAPVCYPNERSETAAAYVEAAALLNDEFDTSGMSESFCADCGHDPCVAEYRRFPIPGVCGATPRSLSVGRVVYPIKEAGDTLTGQAAQVYRAVSVAVYSLEALAEMGSEYPGAFALRYLVRIRDDMRRVVAS